MDERPTKGVGENDGWKEVGNDEGEDKSVENDWARLGAGNAIVTFGYEGMC